MKTIGDYIRVNHDGSWSMWQCKKCGKVRHFVRYEEPDEKCDCGCHE